MDYLYAVVGLIIGIIIGIVIARLMTPEYKKHKKIQKELESTKFELEQRSQELADHFANSAQLLDTLGKDYTKLYQHMAQSSADLLSNQPNQDNPFITQQAKDASEEQPKSDEVTDIQPKDYAKGATGLLKDKPHPTTNVPPTNKAS